MAVALIITTRFGPRDRRPSLFRYQVRHVDLLRAPVSPLSSISLRQPGTLKASHQATRIDPTDGAWLMAGRPREVGRAAQPLSRSAEKQGKKGPTHPRRLSG